MRHAGDKQAHHVRRIGDQQYGNPHIQNHPPGHEARYGKRNPHHLHHIYREACLRQAQGKLIDHMGRHIGRDVHARPVFPLDDGPLTANGLNGIEAAVPDRHACQRKRALEVSLHRQEKILADYHAHQRGDDRRHGQHLPVALVDEKAQLFSHIDGNLTGTAPVADPSADRFVDAYFSHAAPPHTSK